MKNDQAGFNLLFTSQTKTHIYSNPSSAETDRHVIGWVGVALHALGRLCSALLPVAWLGTPPSMIKLLSATILHPLAYAAVTLSLRLRIGRTHFLAQPSQTAWFLMAAALSVALATGIDLILLNALGFINWLKRVSRSWDQS